MKNLVLFEAVISFLYFSSLHEFATVESSIIENENIVGCITSVADFALTETLFSMTELGCVHFCRINSEPLAVRDEQECYCGSDASKASPLLQDKCPGNRKNVVNVTSIPLPKSCWELYYQYGLFTPGTYTIQSSVTVQTIEVSCNFDAFTFGQKSLLFSPGLRVTVEKDGNPLDLNHMNPYDDSQPGLDITGNGITLTVEDGLEMIVTALKLPADASFPFTFQMNTKLTRWNDTEWYNPDRLEDTSPGGTVFSILSSDLVPGGSNFHFNIDPRNSEIHMKFGADVVKINGTQNDFKLDLLGIVINADSRHRQRESFDIAENCQYFSDDSETQYYDDYRDFNQARGRCSSTCTWLEKHENKLNLRYYAVRRTGPRQFKCKCMRFGTELGGSLISGMCNHETIICEEVRRQTNTLYTPNASLMSFLSSSSELPTNGSSQVSVRPNMCNDNRTDDIAAAYLATTLKVGTSSFYNDEIDLDDPFVYPVHDTYSKAILDVEDLEILPHYRRILREFPNPQDYLVSFTLSNVKSYAYGIYYHCTTQISTICSSMNQTEQENYCMEVFLDYQKVFLSVINKEMDVTHDLKEKCREVDLIDGHFYPYFVHKRWSAYCMWMDDKIHQLAGIADKNGYMTKYDSANFLQPIPGTNNSYHCANSWTWLDGQNEPQDVICYPNRKNNFGDIQRCYPPQCKDMEPSNVVSFPAPGTRDWDKSGIGNGQLIGTKITYTCPEKHAFNRDLWTNDLVNECIWSDKYSVAVWKYWESPGPNMASDPRKLLPDCVPYCFDTNFILPDLASQTLDLDYNIQGQIARISCDLGYEYTDQIAKDADSNFNPGDDFLMKTRTKQCVEEFVGNGGTWRDDHPIPDSCYVINCTRNSPPPLEAEMEWDYTGSQPIVMPYLSTITYTCLTFGKKFYDSVMKEFHDEFVTTCTATKEWNYISHIYDCKWYLCINPPSIPASSNLQSDYDVLNPPEIGQKVTYTCNAGGVNKFKGDINRDAVETICKEDNVLEPPNPWPECLADITCPFPTEQNGIQGNETDQSALFSYRDAIEWSCVDRKMKIKPSHFHDSLATASLLAFCDWNTETWSPTISSLSCIIGYCIDIPIPSPGTFLEQASHLTETRITVGNSVLYQCLPNHYFDNQVIPTDRSLHVMCKFDGDFETVTWPNCIHAPSCSSPPKNSSNPDVTHTWLTGDSLEYGTVVNYKCVNKRYYIKKSSDVESNFVIQSSCQWNTIWSLDSSADDLVCELKRCLDPPDASEFNLKNDWDGSHVLLGEVLTYNCLPDPLPTYFSTDRSETTLSIRCQTHNGEYDKVDGWPTCVSDINCGSPIPAPSPLGTMTYLNFAPVGQDTYLTQIEYSCGEGRSFIGDSPTVTSTCQWNTEWTITTLPDCKTTHCIDTPVPPTSVFMEDRQPMIYTKINEKRTYYCKSDAKFETNITQFQYDLQCFANGTFETPDWPTCLSTVQCEGTLPEIPKNGKLFVNGEMYQIGPIDITYQTTLAYECGPSKKFLDTSTNQLYEHYSVHCNWNKTWTPSLNMDDCVYYECPAVIEPPLESNLIIVGGKDGPVRFNTYVGYQCKPGYYAESDITKTQFRFLCQTDGTFNIPLDENGTQIWERCVDTVYCPTPPDPLPYDGERIVIPPPEETMKKRRKRQANLEFNYQTTLRYSCGPGRRFYGLGTVPRNGTKEFEAYYERPDYYVPKYYKYQDITCYWDKTWVPEPKFDDCFWVQCVKPPEPPEDSYLGYSWDGNPVTIGNTVKYNCLPYQEFDKQGNMIVSRPRFFEENKFKLSMKLECKINGLYGIPETWPKCVYAKTCQSYPVPSSKDMTHETIGDGKDGTITEYTCGPFGKFDSPRGYLYEIHKKTCDWDTYYYPDYFDPCKATRCVEMPIPSSDTLLYEIASTEDMDYVRVLLHQHRKAWKNTTSDSGKYSIPTLPVPGDYCIKGDRNDSSQLLLIASIPSESSTVISFENKFDGLPLSIQIYPKEKYILRYTLTFKDQDLNSVVSLFGGPDEIKTTIDPDEPFILRISCDEFAYHLKVQGDPVYPDILHDFDPKDLSHVMINGPIKIRFFGFVPEDFDPSVPVDFLVVYRCPEEHFFKNDFNFIAKEGVRCQEDGYFDEIDFRTCIPLKELLELDNNGKLVKYVFE